MITGRNAEFTKLKDNKTETLEFYFIYFTGKNKKELRGEISREKKEVTTEKF